MMTSASITGAQESAPITYTLPIPNDSQVSITKTKSFIWVTFQKEGIHRYPAAGTDPKLATGDWLDVSFLATPHRHIFHFRVEMEVFHDDRDVEFIQLKRILENWYSEKTLSVDYKSCEMIAKDLYDKIIVKWPGRDIRIEVSEDGENGCRIYFDQQ
jgi:hypothetical protein